MRARAGSLRVMAPVVLVLASGCAKAGPEPESAPQQVAQPIAPTGAPPAGTAVARFAGYAATVAGEAAAAERRAALIVPESLLGNPTRLACQTQPAAVAINLDPGRAALNLADPPTPAPGLSEALAAIRAAGVRIFWVSDLPLREADRIYAVLRATGLDLDGTDRILLPRKAGETAHQRLLAAARDWCFVALAGDRMGDFEPAFDYLRDPEGPIAQAMLPLIDDGWFVIPQPID